METVDLENAYDKYSPLIYGYLIKHEKNIETCNELLVSIFECVIAGYPSDEWPDSLWFWIQHANKELLERGYKLVLLDGTYKPVLHNVG